MSIMEKAKRGFDWLHRAYFLAEILLALGVGSFAKAILVSFTHIPPAWGNPIWFSVTGLALVGAIPLVEKIAAPKSRQTPSGAQVVVAAAFATPPIQFDPEYYLERAYNSSLLAEAENNFRVMAYKHRDQNEREEFLIRFIATGLIGYVYEIIWAYIYRSQVLLLQELNRRPLELEVARTYYDEAALQYPVAYSRYPLHEWLEWLRVRVLILQEGTVVGITVRGKDFLKFLVHYGFSPDDKAL